MTPGPQADYVLEYRNTRLVVIEAKIGHEPVSFRGRADQMQRIIAAGEE